MRSDSEGDDYGSLATLVAVAIAPLAKHRHTLVLLPVVAKDEDSRHLRHAVVDARDRQERGGRQPSSREAHMACFLRPTYKVSYKYACALRCSGAANSWE